MRVETLVALARVSVAAGYTTRDQMRWILKDERAGVLLQIDNRLYLKQMIGKEEFEALGHHITLGRLENKVQMINHALGRF